MSTPRVSVVMAAYNVEAYVEAAVRSILEQTYTDFELIVIDDGSTDGTWAVLERLAGQDGRMRIERNAQNLGIARTRNRGTELARGEYIAVMDADDWCPLDRLEKQMAYLDQHPEVGVLGGQVLDYYQKNGALSPGNIYPLSPGFSAWYLHFGRATLNSTVMMRSSVVAAVQGYRPEYTIGEDTDLWQRLGQITKIANLPDVLLYRRRHDRNTTRQFAEYRAQIGTTIAKRSIEATLGESVTHDEVMLILRFRPLASHQARMVSHRLFKLATRFRQSTHLTADEWRQVRQDAARRILELDCSETPWYRYGGSVLFYAARLDLACTVNWLVSALEKSARYRFKLGLKRLQGVRTS